MAYTSDWKPIVIAGYECPKCASSDIEYRDWLSHDGAHEDQHIKCADCGHNWCIEGCDS